MFSLCRKEIFKTHKGMIHHKLKSVLTPVNPSFKIQSFLYTLTSSKITIFTMAESVYYIHQKS